MGALDSKPRVLLVNSVIYLPGEGGHKRTLYLFELMRSIGYKVTLLTSTFNHYSKLKRDIARFRREYPSYSNIEFIDVTAYGKMLMLLILTHFQKPLLLRRTMVVGII